MIDLRLLFVSVNAREKNTYCPETGTINAESGIYRYERCGVERADAENHKFPPCGDGKIHCAGQSANWTLVHKTQTK